MRLLLRRFPALGGLQLLAFLCATMAGTSSIHAATITVTTTADSGAGSLRDAIATASDGDTIQFAAALNGQSIMLTSAELAIDKNITINGPGPNHLTVTKSSGTFRILHVLPGHTVKIEGLTIRGGNGNLGPNGSGVLNDHATLTMNRCAVQNNSGQGIQGAGIYNDGSGGSATLVIFNSTVSDNASLGATIGCFASGGGIYNSAGGTLTITNSSVSNNNSGQPSGPLVPCGDGGGISNLGELTITNTTISGNSAGIHGGGIYNAGALTITSSTVSGNRATGFQDHHPWGEGGGIYNGVNLSITNSTISNNDATWSGGGVGNSGSLDLRYSTLAGNTAFEGGGITNHNSATLFIGHTVLKNAAAFPGGNITNHSGTINSLGYNLSSDNGAGFLTAPGDQNQYRSHARAASAQRRPDPYA